MDPPSAECSAGSTATNVQHPEESPIKRSPAKAAPMSSPFANVQADAREGLQRSGSRKERRASAEHVRKRSPALSGTHDVDTGDTSRNGRSSRQDASRCTLM